MTQYSEFKDQVVRNIGGKDDVKTLALIMANFNLVQETLARHAVWEDLEVVIGTSSSTILVHAQEEYTYTQLGFSAMYHEIYSIKLYADSRWYPPMTAVTPIRWDKEVAPIRHTSEGKPYVYCRYAKKLRFFPTPDAAYPLEIRASIYPTTVTGDSTVITYTNISNLLVGMTTLQTLLSLGDNSGVQIWTPIVSMLLKGYNIDLNQVMNFQNVPSGQISTTQPNYWSDPFTRRIS